MNESISELHEVMEMFFAQGKYGYSTEYQGQKVYVGMMPLDTVHHLAESYKENLPRLQKMIDDTQANNDLAHVTEFLCSLRWTVEMYIMSMEDIINGKGGNRNFVVSRM
jgi:hypothetical protein